MKDLYENVKKERMNKQEVTHGHTKPIEFQQQGGTSSRAHIRSMDPFERKKRLAAGLTDHATDASNAN